MGQDMIRLLKADEIECRIATINEKGLSLLLYKDARVDQRILDETFGIFGWKRSHQCIDGNLYCTVEIFNKDSGEWISKQDVGTMSYSEKEKGQASDSFKRACFNWGIGRELYTAPFIWIPAGKAAIQSKESDSRNKEKKYYCYDRFLVSSIEYNDDREISSLVIINEKGQAVYVMKVRDISEDEVDKKGAGKSEKSKRGKQKGSLSTEQMTSLLAELDRTGVAIETVRERYKIPEMGDMSEELYRKVMAALSKTKSAA
jgi:hypothetical protein